MVFFSIWRQSRIILGGVGEAFVVHLALYFTDFKNRSNSGEFGCVEVENVGQR